MAAKLTKKQKEVLTDKITGLIRSGPALRMTTDSSVNDMNINQISGELNRIHYRAIGKDLPAEINIPVKQLGSGDPSPDNIRPIVGYEITGIGTVYGGDLNIETGVLTVAKQMYQPESVDRINQHSSGFRYWLYPALPTTSIKTTIALLSEYSSNVFRATGLSVVPGNFYVTSDGTLLVSVPWEGEQSITTLDSANEWLEAYKPQFLIPLETPETYTLTPQQMLQLLDQL